MTLPLRVAQAEAAIIAAEGEYHVAGRYYAKAADAAKARRVEAERRVRYADRLNSLNEMLSTRWEVTPAGRAALGQPVEPSCLIGHDGVCRTHDEPCARIGGSWRCLVGEMAS